MVTTAIQHPVAMGKTPVGRSIPIIISGQQLAPGYRANREDVGIGEAYPFCGKFIEIGRFDL